MERVCTMREPLFPLEQGAPWVRITLARIKRLRLLCLTRTRQVSRSHTRSGCQTLIRAEQRPLSTPYSNNARCLSYSTSDSPG